MSAAGWVVCLGELRSPAGAAPERHLQPAAVPENLLDKSGFLAFGRHGGMGKTPLTRSL